MRLFFAVLFSVTMMVLCWLVMLLVIFMFKDRGNEAFGLLLLVMVVKELTHGLILVASLVLAKSLTVVNAMFRLLRMASDMLNVLIRVVTIHVAFLTAVESVVRLLMHRLFNNEVDGLVLHVMVVFTA